MSFRSIAGALATVSLLASAPAIAQTSDTPTGKSDTTTDGAKKTGDMSKSGGMMKSGDMMKSGGMMKSGSVSPGSATKTGGPSGGVPGKS